MTLNASTILRPRVILPSAAIILVAVVLMTPQPAPSDRNEALTTFSTGIGGAHGLYETLHRLGWPVVQRKRAFMSTLDTNAVYVTLDPKLDFTGGEVHRVLDAVRRGAGLVYVIQNGWTMADSLHLAHFGGTYLRDSADSAACAGTSTPVGTMWFDNKVRLYGAASKTPWPADTVHFLPVERLTPDDTVAPPTLIPRQLFHHDTISYRTPFAAVGFPYGRGRILAVADADAFRNDVIRVCQWDVGRQVVNMMTWVSGEAHPTLVFDEYHHGYQTHDHPTGAWASMGEYLSATPSGRMVAQILVSALVLLLVFGIRPIAPRAMRTIERRSALEHVSALAQAYRQIGASRLAVRRLTRGLRRRHTVERWTATGSKTDALFLDSIAARYPTAAPDIAEIRKGESHAASPHELVEIAEGIARIDQILHTHRP